MANKKYRTRQITVETHSVTIIRTKGKSNSAYCEYCRMKVASFTPEQIAEMLQTDLAEIYRRLEMERIHLVKNELKKMLICGNSLESTDCK